MKKAINIVLSVAIFVLSISVCFNSKVVNAETTTLRVYNCEDYIDKTILDDFEEEYGIEIVYSVYGTNEDLYNDLKINPNDYDLICPSDYMIQKMAREKMIRTIDSSKLTVYNEVVSDYFKGVFNEIKCDGEYTMQDYAIGYMWGTLGLVYNPEFVSDLDMESWASLWESKYANKSTIKDSIRDSFFMGLAKVYKEELDEYSRKFEAKEITIDAYKTALADIFNRTDEETLNKVEKELSNLKKNIYGFEVDTGKSDVATGKITINFAWSGDAVYAMDEAEGADTILKYSVPKEGSNVWFDGWCVPKNVSDEKMDAVYKFLNYLSRPSVAIANMEEIGYTSVVTGSDEEANVLEWVIETYELKTEEAEGYEAVDLRYLFGDEGILYTDVFNRQFYAQYPDQETINRCAIMQYFDKETNDRLSAMWERVKGESLPIWAIILILVVVVVVISVVVIIVLVKKGLLWSKKGKKKRKI